MNVKPWPFANTSTYSDIYVTQTNMVTYSSGMSFDGEGAITLVIDYVVSDEHPQIYILQGHGESDLPETFSNHIKNSDYPWTVRKARSWIIFSQIGRKLAGKDKNEGNYPFQGKIPLFRKILYQLYCKMGILGKSN